ncbi:acylphosphatase [uncultured Roseibium sp.]|uniref:acylphosphatase n=1 Tax=uncultured Roseibium sp. TaxID=1936171 RepID=UPI003217434B
MTAAGKCVRAVIRGRVQGVGYRAWCAQAATAYGLSGWVRNRRSGEVEALFIGEEAIVDTMLAAVWEGPRFARVLEVEVNSETAVLGEGFEIRDTV